MVETAGATVVVNLVVKTNFVLIRKRLQVESGVKTSQVCLNLNFW